MGGKSWAASAPVRVSGEAGRVWAEDWPDLPLWESYRRAVLSRCRAGDVEVTDVAAGVVYCVDPDGTVPDGWVIKTLKGRK